MMKFPGIYHAVVINNVDPLLSNRVQVTIPSAGVFTPIWSLSGDQASGSTSAPSIGSSVWIKFDDGDPRYPMWTVGNPQHAGRAAIPFHPAGAWSAYIGVVNRQGGVTPIGHSSAMGSSKDGWSEVLAFEFTTQAPLAPSSGSASGKRQHGPAQVTTKSTSNGVPPFWLINERLRSIILEVVGGGASGERFVVNQVRFHNPKMTGVDLIAAKSGRAHRFHFEAEAVDMRRPIKCWP